ncbi:MAG: hypothetical protein EHM42_14050, partial [Planctomycetaceae bacterium]
MSTFPSLLLMAAVASGSLSAGDQMRKISVDGRERSFLVHVPPHYDAGKPTPVVLVFHGAGMNAATTVAFTKMSAKSDEAGFIAVYANGTGLGRFLTFNGGGRKGETSAAGVDDVN